jgi:hypothetical protein
MNLRSNLYTIHKLLELAPCLIKVIRVALYSFLKPDMVPQILKGLLQ